MRIKLDQTNGIIDWTDIGNSMLEDIYNTNMDLFKNYKIFNGLDNLYPIFWKKYVDEFINAPYDNYKNLTRNYQPLIALVNSVYKNLENKKLEEILNGHMPLNYFINKSYPYDSSFHSH